MYFFYFDIFLSKKILEKINSNLLKYISILSDFLLFFYCILAIIILFKNILFIVLGWIIPFSIQKLFKKERPYSFFKLDIKYTTPKYHSIPSSHTFLAMFIFFRLLEINYFLAISILIIPILRVLSLQHWFSDVVFSIVLSSAIYKVLIIFLQGII